MRTDTARGPTVAARFALRGVLWSLGVFGLLRLNWLDAHLVVPLTRVQAGLAVQIFGAPPVPVEVTAACSGTDALALCVGAVLAYPVPWRSRFTGAGCGVALILGVNIIRIGTLGQAAASPAWFDTLHLYVWPGVLLIVIAGYVFAWMRRADRQQAVGDESAIAPRRVHPHARPQPSRRFIVLTMAFLLLFAAASPFYLNSSGVLAMAGFIARAAAALLGAAGVTAHAASNVLWTPRGGFLVTQECIATPLIPVYLAAVCSYAPTWRRLVAGVGATLPIFVVLGIMRLLVVALPDVVSPLFLVHAFYQLLLGAVVVFLAALWRHGRGASAGRAVAGLAAGVLFVYLLGPVYTRVVTATAGGPPGDAQGALALLPAFQVGLYLALWCAAFVPVGWRRGLAGLVLLGLTQTAGLVALQALARHADWTAHVRDIRGWAVAGPLLIVVAVTSGARARR